MKLFAQYVKARFGLFVLSGVFALIFGLLFFLYGLEPEAYGYGLTLCLVALTIYVARDFAAYYKAHHVWRELLDVSLLNVALEETTTDPDLRALFAQIAREKNELIAAGEARKTDLTDYFTLWIHQVKLPVSAMRLMLANHDLNEADWKKQIFALERYLGMVLAYLRMKSDSTDYVIRMFSLDSMLRAAIRTFSTEFIYKKIRLSFTPTGLEVLSDEKWLQFVVEQLLSNAIKYSALGSTIEMYANGYDLVIEDHGCGISASDLKRIREKGFTGENGRVHKEESSGLGLYLCEQVLARLHHPFVIESTLNEGTRVVLRLDPALLERE